jgi:hypothetical protein
MLLTPIPWAKRVWALPFLTALCPSQRYYAHQGRGHKKLTDWARQMLLQVRRWLPGRQLVVLADASFAAIELLWHLTQLANPICVLTRLRLDAAEKLGCLCGRSPHKHPTFLNQLRKSYPDHLALCSIALITY